MESFQFFVQMSLYCKIDCVCRAQHSQWRRRGWVPSSTKQIDLALKIIWGTAQLHNTLKLEKLTRNFLHLCAIFGEPMLCVSERQPDPKHLPGRQIDLKWYRSSTHCTTATEWSLAVRAFTNWVHHKFTTTTQTIRDPNFLRHFLWWRTCRSSLAKEEEEIVSSCHSSSQGHGEREFRLLVQELKLYCDPSVGNLRTLCVSLPSMLRRWGHNSRSLLTRHSLASL